MKRKIIVIEIEDLQVNSEYFEFSYEVIVDGESIEKDTYYGSDHSWQNNLELFREFLEESYAFKLVLENINLK